MIVGRSTIALTGKAGFILSGPERHTHGLQALAITLYGVTSSAQDPGTDVWRNVSFPMLRSLAGPEALDGLSLKVFKRGAAPLVSTSGGHILGPTSLSGPAFIVLGQSAPKNGSRGRGLN